MRRHIDLFSGIGGFALACRIVGGYETSVFCEREPFAQRVLRKHWPDVPIIDDVFRFDGTRQRGAHLLTGGFPCQPFSQAGKRRGKEDDRHLWPEMLRIIAEARPRWVLGENVAGFVTMELDACLASLEGIGYSAWPVVVPACAVDAPHRRDRVWIIAANSRHSEPPRRHEAPQKLQHNQGWQGRSESAPLRHAADADEGVRGGWPDIAERGSEGGVVAGWSCEAPADTDRSRREEQRRTVADGEEHAAVECGRETPPNSPHPQPDRRRDRAGRRIGVEVDADRGGEERPLRWIPEPDVGRVAHGVPSRVDRLRGLGNAIVPQVAAEIIRLMN